MNWEVTSCFRVENTFVSFFGEPMVELSSSDETEIQDFLPLLPKSILGVERALEMGGDGTYFLKVLFQGSGWEIGQATGKGQALLCLSDCQA